ncbi:MAG TPA: hypothetical protein VK578_10305 [Edaphobacter sp.]|jgi:hypothetical protein|nr:hypothetical protein [Edaphobacter sp.]
MTALEQVEQLTQQAITILLAEREQIDKRLSQLGYGQVSTPAKRRGRPPLPKGPSPSENIIEQPE